MKTKDIHFKLYFHKILGYSIIKSVIPNRIRIPFKHNLFMILGKGVHEHIPKLYSYVGVKHVSFTNILLSYRCKKIRMRLFTTYLKYGLSIITSNIPPKILSNENKKLFFPEK